MPVERFGPAVALWEAVRDYHRTGNLKELIAIRGDTLALGLTQMRRMLEATADKAGMDTNDWSFGPMNVVLDALQAFNDGDLEPLIVLSKRANAATHN
jgi:hypothetical protein